MKTITYFAKSLILDWILHWVLNMSLFFAVNFGAKRELYPSKTTLAIYQIGFHQIRLDWIIIRLWNITKHCTKNEVEVQVEGHIYSRNP